MYKSQQFPQIKHIHLSLSDVLKKLSSSSTQYVAVSKLVRHRCALTPSADVMSDMVYSDTSFQKHTGCYYGD